MKAFRSWHWFLATMALAVSAWVVSSAQLLADPIPAVTVQIVSAEDSYTLPYAFTDPRFTPDPSTGVINANVDLDDLGNDQPVTAGGTNAEYFFNYSYNPVGEHLSINFNVDGSFLSDTTFTITATSPSFTPISNPKLLASGTLGVSNLNWGLDFDGSDAGDIGPILTGGFGGSSFRTSYGLVDPTDHAFATLVNDPDFVLQYDQSGNPEYGTFTNSVDTGYLPVTGSVGIMQTVWSFTLAANEGSPGSAAITSEFDPIPVPEPSSLALLSLGSLAVFAVGRRMRKARS